MRLIKMFGLAAVAAAIGTAFMGTSTSSATSTALCAVHEEPCISNRVQEFSMKSGTLVIATSLATLLCLSSKLKAHVTSPGLLANPLQVKLLELTWESCGTNAAHNNCTFTNIGELPLIDILKTALNLGTAKFLGLKAGEHVAVLLNCSGITHCVIGGAEIIGFAIEGALHQAATGHGMLTGNELSIPMLSGFLCPKILKLTVLYEPSSHLYLVS